MTDLASRIQSIAASTYSVGSSKKEDLKKSLRFPHYAPVWDSTEKFPPYEIIPFRDRGLDAHAELKNLFPNGLPKSDAELRSSDSEKLVKFGYAVSDLTPKFGSEVRGIQLSQLSDEAKNDLAAFVAERGVVAFRNQDFRNLPVDKALKWAEYYGRQHIHPTSGSPEGYPEVHLVHRAAGNKTYENFFAKNISSTAWHSDVTYELQPPGTTFLGILELPPTGGDTLFANTEEIYNRLSPEFRSRLKGLKAVHSAYEQAQQSLASGGVVRREPIRTSHPLVRTHPVTRKKSIFVNQQFTRYIEGFKSEESDYLLNFLYDVISKSADTQLRVKWSDGDVIIWDNRKTVHSALLDFEGGIQRHAFRYTPMAEVPVEEE